MKFDLSQISDEHGHTSLKGYFVVFFALMALTLITVLLSLVNFGVLADAVIAVLIAALKTTLVVYFFMHVRESPKIIGFIVIGSFAWLSVLFLFTIADFHANYSDAASSIPSAMPW